MNALENYIHQYFDIALEQCKLVADLFKQKTIVKNEFFLKAGKNCGKLSFIDSGILRVFVELPEKEVTHGSRQPVIS